MASNDLAQLRTRSGGSSFSIKRQLGIALYQASNRSSRLYGRLLLPHGLTFPQFQVISALHELEQCTVGALCSALDVDTSTITSVLKRLEAQGFLERFRDRLDERRVIVHLTEKGLAFKADCIQIHASYSEKLGLSESEIGALRQALQKLSAAIEPALA